MLGPVMRTLSPWVRLGCAAIAGAVVGVWPALARAQSCDSTCDAACLECCPTWAVVATCDGQPIAREGTHARYDVAKRIAASLDERAAACTGSDGACATVRLPCGDGVARWEAWCPAAARIKAPVIKSAKGAQLAQSQRLCAAQQLLIGDVEPDLKTLSTRVQNAGWVARASRTTTDLQTSAGEVKRLHEELGQALAADAPQPATVDALLATATRTLPKSARAVQTARALLPEGRRLESDEAAARTAKEAAAEEARRAAADAERRRQAEEEKQKAAAMAEAVSLRREAADVVLAASKKANAAILTAAKFAAAESSTPFGVRKAQEQRAKVEATKAELDKAFAAIKQAESETEPFAAQKRARELKAEATRLQKQVETDHAELVKITQNPLSTK